MDIEKETLKIQLIDAQIKYLSLQRHVITTAMQEFASKQAMAESPPDDHSKE